MITRTEAAAATLEHITYQTVGDEFISDVENAIINACSSGSYGTQVSLPDGFYEQSLNYVLEKISESNFTVVRNMKENTLDISWAP